jgi:nucleotide-binding universal stress UspA family protein
VLAAAFQAQITFAYIVDTALVEERARTCHRPVEEMEWDMEANARHCLHHLADQARMCDLDVKQAICFGIPYAEICGLAQEEGADLIVMGQVGGDVSRRLMMGSVTQRVIELTHWPVLVVKPESTI